MKFPIYFFSVFFNILAGTTLASQLFGEKFSGFASVSEFLNKVKTKFAIGLPTFICGILKLIIPASTLTGVSGSGWVILGDFLPALTGVGLGFALLNDYFKEKAVINPDTLARLDSLVVKNRNKIGFTGIGLALLHLFAYNLPIL